MTDTSLALSPSSPDDIVARPAFDWRKPLSSLFLRILAGIRVGSLSITLPDSSQHSFGVAGSLPSAALTLHHWAAIRRMLVGGDVGFGEAFIEGQWDSPDLSTLVELVARNIEALDNGLRQSRLARWRDRVIHLMNANTRRGSKRNIMRHYDLGNDFYRLWLDDGMNYSSGIYRSKDDSLAQSQLIKNSRITELLRLAPGMSLLEIGCGWGALAERTVKEFNAEYTGLTLSPAQKAIAETRTGGRGAFLLQDYRDSSGTYDRIASVEMIEAVGEANWPAYFATLHQRLKPDGLAVIQAITIAERRYEGYRNGVDFIQKHVFPGGNLPTVSHIYEHAARAGLKVDHEERFGLSYARTLVEWRERFEAAWPEIVRLGFDERFRRLWNYYLAYCEGGFRAGTIDVGLYRLRRI